MVSIYSVTDDIQWFCLDVQGVVERYKDQYKGIQSFVTDKHICMPIGNSPIHISQEGNTGIQYF